MKQRQVTTMHGRSYDHAWQEQTDLETYRHELVYQVGGCVCQVVDIGCICQVHDTWCMA